MNYLRPLLFVVAITVGQQAAANPQSASIELNTMCPPGFELTYGQCKLRSMYQGYKSLYGQGVGGLKTALPPVRDGFSPEQIDLGRYLFFDPILSKDRDMSCASCHDPDKGFSDDKARSVGHGGRELPRGAPSLWNMAFMKRFFWDARATSLEEQAVGPLFDPKEMANNPVQLLSDINGVAEYRAMFAQVYENSGDITLEQIYEALAAFQSSLISLNSRYDWYAHGYHDALNEQEIAGMNVFRSFVARCAECHTPPLFTNQQIAVLGTPEPEGRPLDPGAEVTFNDKSLRAGFKVPSLRNVVKTAPYMHSGRFDNLTDAIEFYTKGRGHAVPEGEDLHLHWHIWEPKLTSAEIADIVAFLGTLTDESFKPTVPNAVPSGLPLTPEPPTLVNNNNKENADD